jgi:hypothetical protein
VFGPDIIKEAEKKVQLICNRLKAAQSRQKSYADSRRRPLTFQVRDFVYLWVMKVNSTNVLDEGLRIGEIGRRMNSKIKSVKQGVYRK